MKLLILTQIIDKNDPVLGFFCEWVKEFDRQTDQITVICLKKGEHDFPSHINVLSLGKEEGISRMKYLWRFFTYIIKERKNYDSVFIHMSQIYAILGGVIWKVMGKKVGLWYAHGKVPFSLKIANLLIDKAFASTKEGYRINTNKLRIVGQGIDVNKFSPEPSFEQYKIITVGRISPVKRLEMCIDAFAKIREQFHTARLQIVGDVGLGEHEVYLDKLKDQVRKLKLGESVVFSGPIKHDELPSIISKAHVFVNMSETGSLDKAILEALSSGVPVVSSNASFKSIINDQAYYADSVDELSQNIKRIFDSGQRVSFRDLVIKNHSLSSLVHKIMIEL